MEYSSNGGSVYLGPLQKKILALLKEIKVAHLSKIAKLLNTDITNAYYALLALKDKGLVKDIVFYEYFKPWGRPIRVRYWYLPEYEKELIEKKIIPPPPGRPGRKSQ